MADIAAALEAAAGSGTSGAPNASPTPAAKSASSTAEVTAILSGLLRAQPEAAAGTEPNPDPAAESPAGDDEGASVPSQPNPDAAAEADDEVAPENAPPWFVKRLQKIKAQRNEAREKAAQVDKLQAQVDELQKALAEKPAADAAAPAKAPKAADPLADLADPVQIQARGEEAQSMLDVATRLIEDLIDDPSGVEQTMRSAGVTLPGDEWSPQAMRQYLRGVRDNAQRIVRAVPNRLKAVEVQQHATKMVAELVPDAAKPDSPLRKTMQQVMALPEVAHRPDREMVALVYSLGLRAVEEIQKGKGKPAETPAPSTRPAPRAPRLPSVGSAAPAGNGASEADGAAERIRSGNGSRADAEVLARAALRSAAA